MVDVESVTMNKFSAKPNDSPDTSNGYVKLLISDSPKNEAVANPVSMRLFSAVFYAVSSCLIMFVNKILLTTYKFPSAQALGIGQMVVTLVVLYIGRKFNVIKFRTRSMEVFRKIWPLPVFYLGNLIFGLGGIKHLSLPMFTVLRRFTSLMTLVGEYFILHIKRSTLIISTVLAMDGGAIVAAV